MGFKLPQLIHQLYICSVLVGDFRDSTSNTTLLHFVGKLYQTDYNELSNAKELKVLDSG